MGFRVCWISLIKLSAGLGPPGSAPLCSPGVPGDHLASHKYSVAFKGLASVTARNLLPGICPARSDGEKLMAFLLLAFWLATYIKALDVALIRQWEGRYSVRRKAQPGGAWSLGWRPCDPQEAGPSQLCFHSAVSPEWRWASWPPKLLWLVELLHRWGDLFPSPFLCWILPFPVLLYSSRSFLFTLLRLEQPLAAWKCTIYFPIRVGLFLAGSKREDSRSLKNSD